MDLSYCSQTQNFSDFEELKSFPIKCVLSFEYLINYLENYIEGANSIIASQIKGLINQFKSIEDLNGEIKDLSVLDKHQDMIKDMMSTIFPPFLWETEYIVSVVPFSFQVISISPKFENLLINSRGIRTDANNLNIKTFSPKFEDLLINSKNIKTDVNVNVKTLYAYSHILSHFYGMDVRNVIPSTFRLNDPKTGLERCFQANIDIQFCNIITKGELPKLDEKQKQELLDNLTDINFLMKVIPPENFEFHGFTIMRATDVTEQEMISDIKNKLLDKDSIILFEKFTDIQEKVKALFKLPELTLGLVALREDEVLIINIGTCNTTECIYQNSTHYKITDFAGTIYEKCALQGAPLFIGDIQAIENKSETELEMLRHGKRSIVIAPLHYKDNIIGILAVSSPYPRALNPIKLAKIHEILPLFAIAVRRSLDEFENNIQLLIQDKFTSIHPSIAWRFRKTVLNYLRRIKVEPMAELKPIILENLFPLYGVTDIRGSSTYRNTAIQKDLIEHLTLSKDILRTAYKYHKLPLLDELIYRIEKNLAGIESGIESADEIRVINFLKREVETCFEDLKTFGEDVVPLINEYQKGLDPKAGSFHEKQKDFDESVALINQTISTYLDLVQYEAQAMFPHYFDKQVTDGVDHTIYIGQSITDQKRFDILYLKNLRLWQLIIMCNIALKLEDIKPNLKVPLDTTHLIMVQDIPITLHFDTDEKRFRVDGVYNIRYEIMKKRIDKAVIKGTDERLTQPGKIAIVYSQNSEAHEYLQYIDYLQAKGYLEKDIEDVDVEDLQGIRGLKALRVCINLNREYYIKKNSETEFSEAFSENPAA
ncbi:MAG: GAF domain-containing protein [Desulfobacterales bacterium]|nr:GAF domain-containing protein [Desulfobacterales bacterium]